ncbi:MAG: ATP synthase F1 subunit epsilon [Alphaproteobacteria bacterium]|nr:ATP synthase F1 subunit epsilon [Alphaproteobacteria bacterium]
MADIKIDIVAPERQLLSAEADSVSVPGTEGYFTVMGEHAPMMSMLKPGFITVVTDDRPDIYYVRGGFAEVSPEGLVILAEEAQPIREFDRPRIETAIQEARDAMVAAETDRDKWGAELVVISLENLLIEAATLEPGSIAH